MTQYNCINLYDAFANLIDRRPKGDGLDQYIQCSPDSDIQAALAKLVETRRQEQAEKMAQSILVVMEAHQASMGDIIQDLRRVREKEKTLLRQVKATELVGAYSFETGDFVPLRKLIDGHVTTSAQDLGVPNEWIVAYELQKKKG